jgi:hypothetical protein
MGYWRNQTRAYTIGIAVFRSSIAIIIVAFQRVEGPDILAIPVRVA